jgi:predicted nucleic acid-binding protein
VQVSERLVLDANILIRAVLGKRVRSLISRYGSSVCFYAPESAFAEAREHLPRILGRRNIPDAEGLPVLNALSEIVQAVGLDTYCAFEHMAKERLVGRDLEDWPVLATAMVLQCPIWTEDKDFFGSGIAIWTTDRVELFLREAAGP